MDVFISYARETEAAAITISNALLALNYGVWRDDQLPPHRPFTNVTQERLDAAKAVLVIWSEHAVDSVWVRSEADRARQQGKLVQVAISPVNLPMPFDQIHCVDLTGWDGISETPGWRAVLRSLADLMGTGPRETGPIRPTMHRPVTTNLPLEREALVGRDDDNAAVDRMISGAALVTIVGSGGVGKTSLALAVARQRLNARDDGVWVAELAGISDAERVPEIVAKAMRFELAVGEDAGAVLIDRLRRRQCLIVIDNCEHLLDAVAALAEGILAQAPLVKLLVTSQEVLGLRGEQVYRLAPLAGDDADSLFLKRARATDPAFNPNGKEAAAMSAICRRLDGVPLAIEMAAARAPALGCTVILQRLDDRFRALTAGHRTALPRQRTLLGALEWSHSLLNPRDATVFRRLGVFVGGFSLQAAVHVATAGDLDEHEVAEAVSSLAAKSLVTVKSAGDRRQYILLETTRAYALERLAAEAEVARTRRTHAEWYATFAQPVWSDFTARISDADFLSRYMPEFENIHAALDWAFGSEGDAATGLRLLGAAACLMDDRALLQRLDVAIPRLGPNVPAAVRARLLAARAHATMRLDPSAALHIVDEAIESVRSGLNDPVALCDVLASKASALFLKGRLPEARSAADEMTHAMAGQPPSRIKAFAMALDASLKLFEAGPAAAMPLFETAIAQLRSFGANGLANYWRWTQLRMIPSGDLDTDIANFRDLLAQIAAGDMYAESISAAVTKELTAKLALRGTPPDLEEALELAQDFFKAGGATLDRGFLMTMAMVAVKSDRAESAAMIAGYVESRRAAGQPGVAAPPTTPHRGFPSVAELLAGCLGESRQNTLTGRGAHLSETEVMRLAIGERTTLAAADA